MRKKVTKWVWILNSRQVNVPTLDRHSLENGPMKCRKKTENRRFLLKSAKNICIIQLKCVILQRF